MINKYNHVLSGWCGAVFGISVWSASCVGLASKNSMVDNSSFSEAESRESNPNCSSCINKNFRVLSDKNRMLNFFSILEGLYKAKQEGKSTTLDTDAAKFLMNNGCINDEIQGYTALNFALKHNLVDAVDMLLNLDQNQNLDVNVPFDGKTCLIAAVEYNHPGWVEKLLGLGADISMKDKDGNVASVHAAKMVCKLKRENRADQDERVIQLLMDRTIENISHRKNQTE